MDDLTALSSRSAALEALSSLNSSQQQVLSLAAGVVERLFPGDGSIRDESIVPMANLVFLAVKKAKADMETISKSFAFLLQSIGGDPASVPPYNLVQSSSTASSAAVPFIPSDSIGTNGQNESVGALKRKYEENLTTSSPAISSPKKVGAPPKRPMNPKGTASTAPKSPPGRPVPPAPTTEGAETSPKAAPTASVPETSLGFQQPSQAKRSDSISPRNPSMSDASSTASGEQTKSNSASPRNVTSTDEATTPTIASPRPNKAAPGVRSLPLDQVNQSESSTETTSVPNSPTTKTESTAASGLSTAPSTSSNLATPQKEKDLSKETSKEAYKKALEGMVLPPRKKATASPGPNASGASAPSGGNSISINNSSPAAAVSATASSTPDQSEESTSKSKPGGKGTDNGGATSDDDISSDEEEYLRGVEERRLKAMAEKEERLKSAKEAREARQGLYAFLNEEPPPGFVASAKATSSTGDKPKKDKTTKKDKKDKPSAKSASKAIVGSEVGGADPKKAYGNASGSSGTSTPTKRSKEERSVSKSDLQSSNSNGQLNARSAVPDLDLSSSPTLVPNTTSAANNFTLSRDPSNPRGDRERHTRSDSISYSDPSAWTTRYRPSAVVDHSAWQKAEESIKISENSPGRRRWEDYQARYAAKTEAAKDAQKDAATKKQVSSANIKSPLLLKHLKSHKKPLSNSGDSLPATPDSPRRKSSAGSAGDDEISRRPRADTKKPMPKLEVVDDPRVFLFEAPETDSNLRFMERNGEEVLAGGTIEKLIQRLTSASDPSPEYFQCFMLTYHNFLMPQELIELLRLRWNSQPSDSGKMDQFVSNQLFTIRLRIVNVLKMWIETFGNDFKDEAAQAALNDLIAYIRIEYPQMADMVSAKLKRYLSGYHFDAESELDEDPPVPHPISEGSESNPSMIDIHPEEFARQMTLVEHALFKAIPYKELLTNAKAGKTNPNVSNMISYTNHLVNWIGTQILRQENIRTRAITLARFITVAKCCIVSCQNYNGAMEILSALRSSSVFRLKHTWNLLPDNIWDDYEWLENLFESDNNYARYRSALSNAVPPCVPYLGRYLSEVLFLNEIHPDYLSQGPPPVINFAKMVLVADILHHLQRYQKNPFCLTGVPIIQRFFLLKRGVMNEKELYKVSLEREPRETAPQ